MLTQMNKVFSIGRTLQHKTNIFKSWGGQGDGDRGNHINNRLVGTSLGPTDSLK